MRLELAKDSWSNYRSALRKEDCEVFDEMTDKAQLHKQAIMDTNFLDLAEGRLLSILLENEKELRKLKMR